MCPCDLQIAYQYSKAVEQARLASIQPKRRTEKAPALRAIRMRRPATTREGIPGLWRTLNKWKPKLTRLLAK